MDITFLVIIVQLIFLEGILSIDNAAVLGAMVAHLPDDKAIPWPKRLAFCNDWSLRVLGYQRQAALKVGLLGAYVGRGAMLAVAGIVVKLVWVRILGAAYLVYLAINHFGTLYHNQSVGAEDEGHKVKVGTGFWMTVLAIEMADLAFSIDNVIAAVALSDVFWVILVGVAIGIVIMRFAATIFTRMIQWEPALENGAYLLLLAIGAELLLEEFAGLHLAEMAQFAISAAILILTVLIARSPWKKSVRMTFRPLLGLFALIQWSIAMVCLPITMLLSRKNR